MEKKELIMSAALDVFAEKGYHNTKMEEIADVAGIGKGTLYGHFTNKQDLFDQTVFWFLDNYFISLEHNIIEDDSIYDTIYKFIINHIDILEKTKTSFLNVLTDFSNIKRSKEEIFEFHQEFLFNKVSRYSKIFIKAKERGELRNINTELAAHFLIGALKGISESVLVGEKIEDPAKIAEEITDLLCYGMVSN